MEQRQVVWITGGSSGIGDAAARRFAADGCIVVASSRSVRDKTELVGPGRIIHIACDVRDEASVQAAWERISREHGHPDVLVNCAGVTRFKQFVDMTVEEFDEIHATNLRGAFLCTRVVLPGMLERGSGMIVMVNSVAARQVLPNSSVYAASKAGLAMLADCLRLEVRRQGIRIVTVFPGATNTGIWPERVREKHHEKMMTAGDVADAIHHACRAPANVAVEEIVVQPIGGPL